VSDKVREKFEAFMAEGDRSGYRRESLAWVCWLASRAAALEDAAKVCGVRAVLAYERMAAQHHPEDSDRWEARGDWATECADAIRALAGRGA
jgi:hypothetical protein